MAARLIHNGWRVHSLLRSPGSPEARRLGERGVKFFRGDYYDTEALQQALDGCAAVFIALASRSLEDPAIEPRQTRLILSYAKDAGVKTIVCSTILGVGDYKNSNSAAGSHNAPFHKFLSAKEDTEAVVRAGGFESYTLLRPGFLMANFLGTKALRYPELQDKGEWTTTFSPGFRVPMVDEADIASFAVAAIEDPDAYNHRNIAIAGDILTPDQMMATLSLATGREMKPVYVSQDAGLTQIPLAMEEFALGVAPTPVVRKDAISLGTFQQYLQREAGTV